MLHSANSEVVLNIVEETVDFVFKADRVSDSQISKIKEDITETMELSFALALEAKSNFDEDHANANCNDSDLLLLCLRIVEGIEAWGADPPAKKLLEDLMKNKKEEINAMRYCMEDFK